MIYQMHWQFRDGSTNFRSQFEISNNLNRSDFQKKMNKFIEDTQKEHPLPDNTLWMICNETSQHFMGILNIPEENK